MSSPTPLTEKLVAIEQVLDYIRANLTNIRSVWGPASTQHRSAVQLMNECLEENAKRLGMKKLDVDLEELMKGMSLGK
jgi:hypothetical protein